LKRIGIIKSGKMFYKNNSKKAADKTLVKPKAGFEK
jgi:hypothetical protein